MPFVALSTGAKTETHIRRRFRQWFDASGKTQKEAGAVIEWEQQTVSSYFNGEQQIDLIRAITWCEYFGYGIDDLLAKAPRTKPNDPGLQKVVNAYFSALPKKRQMLVAFLETYAKKPSGRGRKRSRVAGGQR